MVYFLFLIIIGCSSKEHLQETLQRQNPDCLVMNDLTIECPDPFKELEQSFSLGVKKHKKTVPKNE